MYAIIATGGKQYQVEQGKLYTLEKLTGEIGETIVFDRVLATFKDGEVSYGMPTLENVKVEAKIVDRKRAKKVKILKFKRRKHHMKRQGHRQYLTQVQILSINSSN
jgi:large subunit ribosomal protein L21